MLFYLILRNKVHFYLIVGKLIHVLLNNKKTHVAVYIYDWYYIHFPIIFNSSIKINSTQLWKYTGLKLIYYFSCRVNSILTLYYIRGREALRASLYVLNKNKIKESRKV